MLLGLPSAETPQKHQSHVVVSGCSAGALAVFIHIDFIASLVVGNANRNNVDVKGFPDAGWFLDLSTNSKREAFLPDESYTNKMKRSMLFWNSTSSVNQVCLENNRNESWRCLFAPYIYQYIQVPLLIMQPIYDSWQLQNIFNLGCFPFSIDCQRNQANAFDLFRNETFQSLLPVLMSEKDSLFLIDCIGHCLSYHDKISKANLVDQSNSTFTEGATHWFLQSKPLPSKWMERKANSALNQCV